jgi:hypothetical protein
MNAREYSSYTFSEFCDFILVKIWSSSIFILLGNLYSPYMDFSDNALSENKSVAGI